MTPEQQQNIRKEEWRRSGFEGKALFLTQVLVAGIVVFLLGLALRAGGWFWPAAAYYRTPAIGMLVLGAGVALVARSLILKQLREVGKRVVDRLHGKDFPE
jgi:hypothetical protein